jgi:iron(III) transport system permease protein
MTVKSPLSQYRLPHCNVWSGGVWGIALLVALPLLAIASGVFIDQRAVWAHLAQTVLMTYILNTLGLMLGVGIGVTVLGTATAWIVTMCHFWGRRIFAWALLLPLSAPAYILAYTYTDFLEYFGPIQTGLRHLFGWTMPQDYWFPQVRSLPGAIVMLTLVLYPYVYLLARSAFISQSIVTLEASRSLGCNPWQSFRKVALPMARPAIVAGLSLALMETLNDYGTVDYFAVPTFTTGIFRTWFGMGERIAATQLAGLTLLFILVLIGLERQSRRQQQYYQSTNRSHATPRYSLNRLQSWIAFSICLLPILLGFFLPAGVLFSLVQAGSGEVPGREDVSDYGERAVSSTSDSFLSIMNHSLILALITAAIAVLLSIILAYAIRLYPSKWNRCALQISTAGYAIPGAVIAVGTLVPLGAFDNAVNAFMNRTFGISTGLLLSGTIAAVIFAYLVRFLAVSFGAVESSLKTIKPNLDEVARSLGYGAGKTLQAVHLPLIKSGLLTSAILVFVDVMKELPATLIIRPFNFDTLAVRVYNLASDERLAEAALPAFMIVMVGLIPVILLSLQIQKSES